MGCGQHVKQAVQRRLGIQGEQLVHLPHVPALFRISPVHIQHQSLEQVHLSTVPKIISFAVPFRVANDDIHKELCHQLLPLHLCKTVPGIRIFRVHQIEHPHRIPLISQILTGLLVQLTFRVTYDKGLPSGNSLQDAVHAERPGLHAATGTIYRQIAVESGLLRHTDIFPVQHPQYNPPVAA